MSVSNINDTMDFLNFGILLRVFRSGLEGAEHSLHEHKGRALALAYCTGLLCNEFWHSRRDSYDIHQSIIPYVSFYDYTNTFLPHSAQTFTGVKNSKHFKHLRFFLLSLPWALTVPYISQNLKKIWVSFSETRTFLSDLKIISRCHMTYQGYTRKDPLRYTFWEEV